MNLKKLSRFAIIELIIFLFLIISMSLKVISMGIYLLAFGVVILGAVYRGRFIK